MTHAELSESLVRPPGMPPSRCPGVLAYAGSTFVPAREGEGPPGATVRQEYRFCPTCMQMLAIRHALDGTWRQDDTPQPNPEILP